jgi:putative ABC transport system ATP-binding protein
MIFQFFNLLDDMTVADNILLPAQLAGMNTNTARARAGELLAALRIEQHADAYPARLSGGQGRCGQRNARRMSCSPRPAAASCSHPPPAPHWGV